MIIKGITNMIHKDVHCMAHLLVDIAFQKVLFEEIHHTALLDVEVHTGAIFK